MNKMTFSFLFLNILLMTNLALADAPDTSATVKATFPPSNWVSLGTNDTVTVQNGAGIAIVVFISVDRVNVNSPGINISNCGTTTHVDAGSSTVCSTHDSTNPITFSSEKDGKRATGNYQVKQE
jgi:hypothetical protein